MTELILNSNEHKINYDMNLKVPLDLIIRL